MEMNQFPLTTENAWHSTLNPHLLVWSYYICEGMPRVQHLCANDCWGATFIPHCIECSQNTSPGWHNPKQSGRLSRWPVKEIRDELKSRGVMGVEKKRKVKTTQFLIVSLFMISKATSSISLRNCHQYCHHQLERSVQLALHKPYRKRKKVQLI